MQIKALGIPFLFSLALATPAENIFEREAEKTCDGGGHHNGGACGPQGIFGCGDHVVVSY